MIAYCGLTCDTCPVYLATLEEDKNLQLTRRASIAQLCSETYGMEMKPEDITDCDGCVSNKRLFSGCMKCEIRTCANQRSLLNCAYCDDYACEKLAAFLGQEPSAQTTLETIRKTLV